MRLIALLAGAFLVLTGCASTPDRADVIERAQLELSGSILADVPGTAEGIADDALSGQCGSDTFRDQLADLPDYQYAWDVTCAHYFGHDMTEAQRERVRVAVLERALSD